MQKNSDKHKVTISKLQSKITPQRCYKGKLQEAEQMKCDVHRHDRYKKTETDLKELQFLGGPAPSIIGCD